MKNVYAPVLITTVILLLGCANTTMSPAPTSVYEEIVRLTGASIDREQPEDLTVIPEPTEIHRETAVVQGTGFLLHKTGLTVTNYHVVADKSNIQVFFPSKNRTLDAEVQLNDMNNDLVVLRLKGFKYQDVFSSEIPYTIRSSSLVQLGEEVFTLGFPLGLLLGKSPKFSSGMVSSRYGLLDNASLFQISNPIQPGNSGGPLFDDNANLVGIVLASLNAKSFYEKLDIIPQNVNFAIKSDYLINLISMLPESKDILEREASLEGQLTKEQVLALLPYVVTVYAR